jgi:hypothetical protein
MKKCRTLSPNNLPNKQEKKRFRNGKNKDNRYIAINV